MAKQKKILLALFPIALILAALRILVIKCNIEQDDVDSAVYFLKDNVFVTVFAVAFVVISVGFAVALALMAKGKKVRLNGISHIETIVSLFSGFFMFGTAIAAVFLIISKSVSLEWHSLITLVLLVVSTVYFFYSGSNSKCVCREKLMAVIAVAPILFTASRLLSDFISRSSMPFASSGAYHIVGLCVLTLFFLSEGKMLCGNGNPSLLFLFGVLSVFCLTVYSLPCLVLHGFWMLSFDLTTIFCVVDLVLAVYIGARLWNAGLVSKEQE